MPYFDLLFIPSVEPRAEFASSGTKAGVQHALKIRFFAIAFIHSRDELGHYREQGRAGGP